MFEVVLSFFDIVYIYIYIYIIIYKYKKFKHLYKHSSRGHCPKKHTNKSRQFHHTVALSSDTYMYFDPFLNCLGSRSREANMAAAIQNVTKGWD